MTDLKGFDRGALYYPYIHVRDDNWLKATLLTFPYLDRMVPQDFTVNDGELARQFAKQQSRVGPKMLNAVEIDDGSAGDAQWKLANRLVEDVENLGDTFVNRFTQEVAERDYKDGRSAFQIGSQKFLGLLGDFRSSHPELFWEPDNPNRGGTEWVGVHPTIGEAIMTATAAQMAQLNSLDIVTNRVKINESAVSGDVDVIYDQIVHEMLSFAETSTVTQVNDLCRLFIHSHFDLSNLSVDEIFEMNAEGADLAALKRRLAKVLAGMPHTLTRELYEDYLGAYLRDAVDEWEAQTASFGGFFKRLFGGKALDEGEKYVHAVAKEVLPGGIAVLGGALVANLPGLMVGLAFHAGKSAYDELNEKQRGEFRYLSKLQTKDGAPKGHNLVIAQPATAAA